MANVITGTSGNDRLTAISDTSVKAGAGNDTINVAGAQNVTIETGSGKDEILFPYEGYNNPSVTFTDFDPKNDVLNFPEWAFFYKSYYFRASIENGNLILKDDLGWYTLTFQGVTSTDKIKDTLVKKWDGYSGKLGGILYNTISGSSENDTNQSSSNVINLTNDNDNFNNSRSKVKIQALAGNDTVYNSVSEVTISGGDGKDSIWNHEGNKTSLIGGAGDDYIANEGNNVTISGGEGKDSIWNYNNSKTSINGGADDDSIENYADNVTISGGKGSDGIFNDCMLNLYDGTIHYYNSYGSNVLFEYNSGDGNDTICGFKSNSTLSISGGSYSSVTSNNDVIIKVGDGSVTLKDAKGTSLNIIGTYNQNDSSGEETSEEFRKSSASALNEFIEIGKGTDTIPSYTSKDSSINKLAEKVSKSSIYIVRLMGKIFGEKTKYQLNDDGSPKLDSSGNKIKDDSPSKTIIKAGYSALLNVDSILTSAKKIAGGKLSEDKLLKEELNISTQTAALVDNISKLGGDPKAGFITPFGSAAVGLATNVINGFAGGIDKSVVTGFTNNFKTLLTETLKKLDKNPALKDTALGTWLKGKAAGTKIESFVDKIVGKTVVDHIGTAVSSFLGVYSAVTTYLDSTEKYNIDGLPDASATINKTIDVIADGIHSFSNAFVSTATAGILDADTIFTGVYNVAAAVKWSFQHGWALATGGDVSKVKFQTEDRNFTEIIGDFVKGLVTGTTNAKDVFNEKNKKKIYTEGNQDNHITNFGSQCTINSGVGNDLVFNHEGTKSNYVDAGNDDDTVVAHGTSNSILGGQGNDRIALYSDRKTPAGGNLLNGGAGNDQILIDDTAYATLPRKSNNTILGGQGDDLIAIEDTKIPVVLRYKAGDGKDYVFGYDKNDTIQIVNSEYSTKKSGQDVVITIGKGSVTLMGAKGKKLNIEKITDDSLPKGLSYDKKKTTLTASTKFVDEQIDLSNYAGTVTKVKASSLVTGVNIVGNALANEIIGGKGSDTLSGGTGKDTLAGGKGEDSLKGGADADILKGEDDNDKLYGEAGSDTLDGGKGNDELYGGAGNDCLVGGKGSDTFSGGKGNDSLWGNAGVDTFIYGKGDGQDIIYGFDKTDLLQITGTFSASYSKAKKEIYFDVGTTTNAITLKDFGSTASFNVNGTNYKISGTKLIKK